MGKGRLEAFSDGVIAVLITIMVHTTDRINGAILWANLHLLFWLSLVPFTTGWMGENHFAPLPTAVYGGVLMMSGIAFMLLESAIIRHQGEHSKLASRAASTRR